MAVSGSGYSISAIGATPPIAVTMPLHGQMLPGIVASLTTGATLTYNIEVTADDIRNPSWTPASGNWVPLGDWTGITASKAAALLGLCTAVRANVTAYTGGTLTFNLAQIQG